MPYEQKTSPASVASNHDELVREIAAEFTKPTQTTLTQAAFDLRYQHPYIIEGQIRNSDRLEVYVVWDKWSGIREEHRTSAILDAYKLAPDPTKAQRVIIALGVTSNEARELGIV